jgi:hypothetical protein
MHARTYTITHAHTHARTHAHTHARTHTHTHSSAMGPLFFTLALYLPLPAVVAAVAYEREVGVRAQMRAMGLGSAVYWAVTHAFWAAALAAYAALLIGAAAVARLPSGYRVSIVAANDAGPLAAAAAAWALNTVGLGLVAGTIARTARAGQARPLCSPPPTHPPVHMPEPSYQRSGK